MIAALYFERIITFQAYCTKAHNFHEKSKQQKVMIMNLKSDRNCDDKDDDHHHPYHHDNSDNDNNNNNNENDKKRAGIQPS